MSERLSWFMGVMQAWFNRPDKLSVIRQHRENGRKIERWVLVEMGAALEELHAGAPDTCGFGCHELDLEKCSFFISQEYVSPELRRPGYAWPLPPAPNDIWVEFRCRTLKNSNDFSGFLGDLKTDLGKQWKRRRAKGCTGHFVAAAMLLFDSGVSADLINAWKIVLANCPNTNVLFSKVGDDCVPVAMLAGWEG